ncbi:SHOCT domain-containing protein [Terrimicrobium sacchariphilum]|nr:SHOCT domain-containing protein [Terrimicrobium sacchariphilum]
MAIYKAREMVRRQISPQRKVVFYIGMALLVAGALLFLSTFLSAALHFGDFSNFADRSRSMILRAVVGALMIVVGGVLQSVGRAGLAGSGLKLDPEEARRDVEPWARMGGGVVRDILDEAGISPGAKPESEVLTFDEKLRRLQKLRDDGLISAEEFEDTKKRILSDV